LARTCLANGGYNARQVEHAVAAQPPLRVEIVKRPDDSSRFIVLSNGPFRGSAETDAWPRLREPR
jgi:hypothetical protein